LINYYGENQSTFTFKNSQISIDQHTIYPLQGTITLHLHAKDPISIVIRLRIPLWSKSTTLQCNGKISHPQPGNYATINEIINSDGLEITLNLDISLHFWNGEGILAGQTSMYWGPILLTYDMRFNEIDPGDLPPLDVKNLHLEIVPWHKNLPPWLLLKVKIDSNRSIFLCDFCNAGSTGSFYITWLNIEGLTNSKYLDGKTEREKDLLLWGMRPD
jgi:hypothetical protein